MNLVQQSVRPHFDVLDGLRGIAAAAVLVGHSTGYVTGQGIIERKHLAVYFFFMLSGFVVAYAYEEKLQTDLSFAKFYLKRVIRLYPLLILGAVLAAAVLVFTNAAFRHDPFAILSTLLAASGLPSPFTQFGAGRFPINPPQWSLFYELVAYGAFGLFVFRLSTPQLWTFVAVTSVGYVSTLALFFGHVPLGLGVFHALAPFGIGVLIWRYARIGKLPFMRTNFWALALVLFSVCWIPIELGWLPEPVVVLLVFPALITAGCSAGARTEGSLVKFLADLSYPVYILHWSVMALTFYVFLPRIGPLGTMWVAAVLSVLVSWIAFIIFDRPIREWLSTRFAGRVKRIIDC